jgi:hypothetical protein
METGDWRLEIGGWRLEAGGWRLEAGDWRLETGDWRLGDWERAGNMKRESKEDEERSCKSK